MKTKVFIAAIITTASFSIFSCKDNNNEKEQSDAGKNMIVITGLSNPESIIESGGRIFVSCIGEIADPTGKDGDGRIAEVDAKGNIVNPNAFPKIKLNAPKGMAIIGETLFVADIDRIVGIDIATGALTKVIDMSSEGMNYLNDLCNFRNSLIVSSTDLNKLYIVYPGSGKYEEVATTIPLNAPNGIFYNIFNETLYVCEYAKDENGTPCGRLLMISVDNGNRTMEASKHRGEFDGISIRDNNLYVSDWADGKVKIINLADDSIKDAINGSRRGPADFLLADDGMWLPTMLDNCIYYIPTAN